MQFLFTIIFEFHLPLTVYSFCLFIQIPFLAFSLCFDAMFLVYAMVNIENIHVNTVKEIDGKNYSSSTIFENLNVLNAYL